MLDKTDIHHRSERWQLLPEEPLALASFTLPKIVSEYMMESVNAVRQQQLLRFEPREREVSASAPNKPHSLLRKFTVALAGEILLQTGFLGPSKKHADFSALHFDREALKIMSDRLSSSPNTYWGIANILISSPFSTFGIFANSTMTAIGVVNDIRSALKHERLSHSNEVQKVSAVETGGIAGWIKQWGNSPGVFQVFDGIVLTGTGIEGLARGNLLAGTAFLLHAIGSPGSIAIMNRKYWAVNSIRKPPGNAVARLWDKTPVTMKKIIMSPAFFWCISSSVLAISELSLQTLSSVNPISVANVIAFGDGVMGSAQRVRCWGFLLPVDAPKRVKTGQSDLTVRSFPHTASVII